MQEINETGGARIGMGNATWPFANLTVNQNILKINASIIGNVVFKPSDIISIEPYSGFMSNGIKISHKVSKYSDTIIFWTMGSSLDLVKRIKQIGFLTNTTPHTTESDEPILKAQSQGSFPLKTSSAIGIVVIWNLLFLTDIRNILGEDNTGSPLGLGPQLALGFMLLTCILLLTFEPVRRLMLKEGRTISDISRAVYFLMFVFGFILLISFFTH